MTDKETKFHSGFAALLGRPNVGKSTLMNALLGEKISIVSAHAQTTRNKITGVWNGDNAQVVFLDTPGMHKPQSKLGEAIRQSTMDALDEVDMIVFGRLVLETDEGIKTSQLVKGRSYTRHVGVRHNVINPGPDEVIFVEVEIR